MNKPRMKQEAAVSWITPNNQGVVFYCEPDTVSEFEQFGEVEPWGRKNQYIVVVDSRFDINEVAAYINSYGKA